MRRILLIDDNETDLYIGKRLFKHYDEQLIIETSLNGREAIEYLHRCRSNEIPHPDIIICDINMPIMDAYGFMKEYEVTFQEYINTCCILICSSTLDKSEMALFKNHPLVRDFLNKPIQPERIMKFVRNKNGP